MNDETKPLFLQSDKPETWSKPDDTSWGDHMLNPNRPLSPRHKRLAELLVAGKRTNEIAEELGYTQARVSVLKSNSKIETYCEMLRDRLFEKTVEERIDTLGGVAVDNIEELLCDPSIPVTKKEALSKWIVEMKAGKAAQKVTVDGAISISHFIDKLEKINLKDVTPKIAGSTEREPQSEGGEADEVASVPVDVFEEFLEKNF